MPFSISWLNRASTLNNNGFPVTVNSDGTGTVNYANVLATSRKLAVSLANTSTDTTFNGTADVTNIKVSGTLPVANGGTGQTSLSNVTVGAATKATQDSDGNAINATYFKSSGNVTLVSGTATKIGTQNGTDVKLTLPTITDTKVTATAKTDNVNYKILATASASPTSGNATEAVYDADITLNPSTNTIAANISGNAATATTATTATNASKVIQKLDDNTATGDYYVLHSGTTSLTTSGNNSDVYGRTGVSIQPSTGRMSAVSYRIDSMCTIQFNSTTNALDFVFA